MIPIRPPADKIGTDGPSRYGGFALAYAMTFGLIAVLAGVPLLGTGHYLLGGIAVAPAVLGFAAMLVYLVVLVWLAAIEDYRG